jgi:two-component system, NarL family, sensor kinase
MLPLKKHLTRLLVPLFFSGSLYAQQDTLVTPAEIAFYSKQLDSILVWIAAGKLEANKRPCNLARHLEYGGWVMDKPVSLTREGLELKGKQKDEYLLVLALKNKAIINYDKKNYPVAIRLYQQALDIAVKNNFDYEELHGLRPALNNSCFFSGDHERAMKISVEGLAKAEKINDNKQAAHFNNVIGYIHMRQGNFAESDKYYSLYLDYTKEVKDTVSEAHALLNMADLAAAQKQYKRSREFLEKALANYESIVNSGLFRPTDRRGFIANKMGETYKLEGNYREALTYALKAVEVLKKDTVYVNDYDEASYYVNAGDIYNHLGLPDSAIIYLQKGLGVATRIIHREYMRDAYEQLAIAFSQKKDFQKAFSYQDLFTKLKDSIVGESSQREIYRGEAALQIERQQRLQEITLQRQRLLRNIIIGIAVLAIVVVIFLYNRYRLKQKNRYQKELNRQQVELFNAIAATQEQERKRIAQDIHDSLGSVLSAAKLKLAEARELKPELATDERFLTGINLLDEASAELRSISHNIMPATLSKLGLVPALKNLSEKISSGKGLQVTFSAHEFDTRLDEQTEISIYRIILELINNIVKHAEATSATVQLVKFPDNINITVEDNGKGFDFSKVSQEKKGIGLGNVFSRVEYMNGAVNVDAVAGRGTTVIIDIPLRGS